MIRAIRPSAVARDDASILTGWNIAPNVGYTVSISVSASAVVVILASLDGATLVGSGLALVGTDQPVTITPVSGQTIGMVDSDLRWHLLVTTAGTEGDRTITVDPMVDLADEIHPIYTDSDMALARATAAINAGACYVDDVSVTCPLGLGAGIGGVASAPVDGTAVVGQVESVTWSGTPDGTSETAVIRRHTAIAPEAYTPPPAPPVLADDVAETDAATATSGNVLTNDTGTLTVSAVNGLSANVGQVVTGSEGGEFVINADGSWTFDPDGDFSGLSGSDTATTSVSYHASDGQAEASATLTITVSSADAQLWTPDMIPGAVWVDANTVTLDGAAVTAMTDKVGGTITAMQGTPSARPTLVADALNGEDVIQFDGGDWLSFGTALGKPANWTVFVVGMFASMPSKTNMCGSMNSLGYAKSSWGDIGVGRVANDGKIEYSFSDGVNHKYGRSSNAVVSSNNWFFCCRRYASGQSVVVDRVNGAAVSVTKDDGTATSCGGTAYSYCIGRSGDYNAQYATAGSRLKGFVCVPSSISDADAARLEGYYAHLCGLTSLLPADHPYKSAPPTL